MALPSTVARKQGQIERYGVVLLAVPDPTVDWSLYDLEIQQAPDSAGAPDTGNAETILRIPPAARSGTPVTITLPNDATRRHWRWRHVRTGYDAGAWSEWLHTPAITGTQGAKPVALPADVGADDAAQDRKKAWTDGAYALRAADNVGKEAFDDLYVGSSKTVKVGVAAAPGSITKTLRVPFSNLLPAFSTASWTTGVTSILPGTANTLLTCRCSFVLPKGVTVTQLAVRMSRADATNDVAEAKLYAADDSAVATLLATCTHTGTGKSTVTASLSQVVGNEYYIVDLSLLGFAHNNDAFMMYFEITYTMPSYDKGY
jgi:hypothetical protein